MARLEAERARWFLWLPVFVGLGIALYFAQPVEPTLWVAAAGFGMALALTVASARPGLLRLAALALFAVALGFAVSKVRTEWTRAPVLGHEIRFADVRGIVELIEPRATRGQRLTIRVTSISRLAPEATPERVRLWVLKKREGLKPGDAVRLRATLRPPPMPALPGGYDFARMAWFQGLGATGYALAAAEIDAPPAGYADSAGRAVRLRLERLRLDIGERIRAVVPGETGAIAVSLIWSVANSKHELEIGAFLRDAFPGIPISLSHEINPIIREYRRTSSAAINAALSPAMASHFGDLADDLTACGFTGDCLVVTSEGGLQPIEKVTVRPILAVNSGPAMAPLAAARYAAEREAIIVCDIGGTTFDVSLVEGGHLAQSREYWLGQRYLGELTGVSSVAVKSVGAGGGSIAAVDAGGLLRVGPRSAGSQPGPACYAQGGELPTVTDAAAVLGYLNADAGSGRFAVRADLAEGALRAHVSQQLGLELAYAARSVLKIAAVGSAAAARETILAEGLDPRTLSMVACGGAGALLACAIADELDIREIVVPLNAGVMAALGAHNASIVSELSVPVVPQPGVSDAENLLRNRATLADKVSSYIANELDGYSHPVQRHFAEARYRGQIWELRIDIPPEILDREDLHAQISEAFHALHQKKNSVCDEAAPVEIVSLGCRVSAELPPRMLKAAATTTSGSSNEALSDSRLDGHALLPGWSGDGPLYIDCPTTTLVVEEGWRAVKDGDDRFVLTRDMKEA